MHVAKHLSNYPALNVYVESLRPIPAGTFQMGSTTGEIHEHPVHNVVLSAFRMGATPVTVAVWREYCGATGTKLPEPPSWGLLSDHPVVNVSWNDIMGTDGNGGFCAWASDVAGFQLTLPTEAQFEYAARGGHDGIAYPWGDDFDQSKLWCSEADFADVDATAPVHRSSNVFQNAYGLSDMTGNVWQWCLDVYTPYTSSSKEDPSAPSSISDRDRCVRGGPWFSIDPEIFRSATRFQNAPDEWIDGIGFRLVAGPPSADIG